MQTKRRLTKRIFFALLAALLWAGFVVDGSHALYTDQVQLTGNSITSGTSNLLISNSQNASSTIFEKSRVGFSSDLSPGEQYEKFFLLKNASDIGVNFKLSLTGIFADSDPGYPMASHVNITIAEVDADGNLTGGQFSGFLSALRNSVTDMNLTIPAGVTQRYKITTRLESSFAIPDTTLIYDLLFTGSQVL